MIGMSSQRFGDATIHGDGAINQGGSRVRQIVGGGRRGRSPGAPDPEQQPVDVAELGADRARNVFVVYGRDEQVRRAVFGLLRRLDLRPLQWEQLVHATEQGSPFLGQVVADAPKFAQAAVVVLTPDDTVLLHHELRRPDEDQHEKRPALQPRPNVLLEAGMVLAYYPQNTLILEFGELRPIADLAGRNVIRFTSGSAKLEALQKVAGRLRQAGCPVDAAGADWMDVAPFADLRAYRRRPL